MRTRYLLPALGCLLATGCAGPIAPAVGPAPAINMRLDPPPVHALLGHRQQLDLTSEQIEALDEVGQRVHSENHPLLLKISEVDQSSRNPLAQEEVLKLAGTIHVNNHQAMERVRGILTEKQRADACEVFNGRVMTRGLRSVTQEGTLHAMSRPTTVLQLGAQPENGPVWSWCYDEGVRTTAAR
jgi:hypothetical protein